jgi:hypothetical protein
VSWSEAARFANCLNVSEGFSPAYKFSTQPGDPGYDAEEYILLWEADDPGYDATNLFRNARAKYFLPSVHEWYKAAYYDPNANGGSGGYWDYPTGSDTPPIPVASGTDAGTAVYMWVGQGPADVTMAGGLSPYGVMGMGGNFAEMEETEWDLVNDGVHGTTDWYMRGLRGGSWTSESYWWMSASSRDGREMTRHRAFGFRVASLPDPCDINGDGTCDVNDIDAMTQNVIAGVNTPADREALITNPISDGFYTFIGDANLDGEFNSGDLVEIFTVGTYETGQRAGWAEGDWNGDGVFGSGDLVFAFQDGGYEQGPRASVLSVPEPSAALLLALAATITVSTSRRMWF